MRFLGQPAAGYNDPALRTDGLGNAAPNHSKDTVRNSGGLAMPVDMAGEGGRILTKGAFKLYDRAKASWNGAPK